MSGSKKMEVKMTFDESKIKELGYTREGVYSAIKRAYAERGIACTSDDDVLAFQDTGNRDDFGNMWAVITKLMREEWYLVCATSCTFEDSLGRENVLSQAWKFRKQFNSGIRV